MTPWSASRRPRLPFAVLSARSQLSRLLLLAGAPAILSGTELICKARGFAKKIVFAVAQRNFALCSLFNAVVSDAREVGWGAPLVLGEAGGLGRGVRE